MYRRDIRIRRDVLYLAFLLFFSILAALVPWPEIFRSINGYPMVDREVYTEYFLYGENVIDYKEIAGILAYYTNEFLWHFGIRHLRSSGAELSDIFFVITFLLYFSLGYLVLRESGPWALVFIVNPLVVDFAFSQLRLALAISLLVWGYVARHKIRLLAILLVIASLFVHSASAIFLAIYIAVWLLDWLSRYFKVNVSVEFLALFTTGALISIAIGPLREAILSAVGDRRVDYPDMASSLKYSLFWIGLLCAAMATLGRTMQNEMNRYAIVILSIVTVNVVHGGYSTRFLAAAFPFLLNMIVGFRGAAKVVLCFFVVYAGLQWMYWLKLI